MNRAPFLFIGIALGLTPCRGQNRQQISRALRLIKREELYRACRMLNAYGLNPAGRLPELFKQTPC